MEESGRPLEERLKAAAGIVAPTTVVSALLLYYGYVTTYARLQYFGIDLAMLRLSTQDLVLRSVGALFLPLGALLVAGVVGFWVHDGVQQSLAGGTRARLLRGAGIAVTVVGVALFARGAVGVLTPAVAEREWPGATPFCLGMGALLTAYGRSILLRVAGAPRRRSERSAWVLVWGLVVLSLFWLTNSFAGAYGRGQAAVDAEQVAARPAVVLDTTERLYVPPADVSETSLPVEDGQRFRYRYRYRNLRLIAAAGGRLFLMPERWRRGAGVLVVPDDDTVRLQLVGG